ncbi:FG-GAP-like repeat-containing protein [Leifsonia sp. NPDC056824]|uniref:FG-GAP-like repeat-containing protein n=1 Tax=Leifsonia sp. NPDC056824 TaxID=3345953 RepID=UPI0036BCC6DB
MTSTRRWVTAASSALTASLILTALSATGAASAAPVPATTVPTVAAKATPASGPLTVNGSVPHGSHAVSLKGTLRVTTVQPVVTKTGAQVKTAHTGTSYAVVTGSGTTVPVSGKVPAGAATGAAFDGTVAVPSGTATAAPLTARDGSVKPLPIANATITPAIVAGPNTHSIDIVIVNPTGAGIRPIDPTTYSTANLDTIASTVGTFWTNQSHRGTDPSTQLAFPNTATVTTITSPQGCAQDIDTFWDQAAVALGYTSAQDYLNRPPAGSAHHLVVLLPSDCQNQYTAVSTIGDGLGSSGLIEETLGLNVDTQFLANGIGVNIGVGSSDLDYCGLTRGPNCVRFYGGDMYDVMGTADPMHDVLSDLNSATRDALGWTPHTETTYALAPGETTHTWHAVPVNDVSAQGDYARVVDPGTQQVYFVEDRATYYRGVQTAMDDTNLYPIWVSPGIRLLTDNAYSGSVVVTEPDPGGGKFNDATAPWATGQPIHNATGTISVTYVSTWSAGSPATVDITITAPHPRLHDYSGDGHPDVLARNTAGALLEYRGDGAAGWLTPAAVQVGSGWNGMTAMVAPGDFDGDGHPDVLARDTTGTLWLYPGNGSGGWGARRLVGTGWNSIVRIVSVGDFNGDGTADIVATDTAGRLLLYPGNGHGGWLSASVIGTGWAGMVSLVGIGDFNTDGKSDLVAEDGAGRLWLYPHTPTGWQPTIQIGTGWGIMNQLLAVGDVDGDGTDDLVARDTSGNLWLYAGDGGTGFWPRVRIGTGWGGMTWMG